MKRALVIFVLIFKYINLFGQDIDTFKVFFGINDMKISKEAINYIDQLIFKDTLIHGQKLIILGYADYLGENKYNYQLSQSRAKNVRDYLVASGFDKTDIEVCIGKGKIEREIKKKDGYLEDRKVQIIIEKYKKTEREEIAHPVFGNIQLDINKLKENDVIPLDHVLFEMGSYKIKKTSYPELATLAVFLDQNISVKIQIEGHLCCGNWNGGGSRNDLDTEEGGMSYKRAKAIYDFLVYNGIDKSRLKYKGLGILTPFVTPERTEADEALNRRIAIRIVSK